MMMTAEYSCGWLGHHAQSGYIPQTPPTTTTTATTITTTIATTMPSPPSSSHRSITKPLRHSIDAILHKAPSSSSSSLSSSSLSLSSSPPCSITTNQRHIWSSQKPTLPHIETLRRLPSAVCSVSSSTHLLNWPKGGDSRGSRGGDCRSESGDSRSDIILDCRSTGGNCTDCRSEGGDCRNEGGDYRSESGDCRSEVSSHSTSPESSGSSSVDEQEDVEVVDVDTDDIAVPMEAQPATMQTHSQDGLSLKESESIAGALDQRQQAAMTTKAVSTRWPGPRPLQSENPASTRPRHALRANPPSSAQNPLPLQRGGPEKVKSAFRPIVRPWLLDNGASSPPLHACSPDSLMLPPAVCRDVPFRSLQAKPAAGGGRRGGGEGARSLDAISMLRKQCSVFRGTCASGAGVAGSRNLPAKGPLPSVDNGQPLPSTLTSWLSWLRLGGLHFAPHPPPPLHQHHHHHHPHQQLPPHPHHRPPTTSCRGVGGGVGVVPPSSAAPGPFHPHPHHHPHPPPQAPRYNCEACGKSYSTFGGLSKHKQFHCAAQVKKDFRCKFCDKSYSSLGALKMHIRTHTLPCKCTVCGKAFSRPWLLQGHLRTHTGEKPFSCPHCARAFADRSNLRAHLQTHSDVKKYSCRHCAKTFSRMSLLLKHRESSCLGLHG